MFYVCDGSSTKAYFINYSNRELQKSSSTPDKQAIAEVHTLKFTFLIRMSSLKVKHFLS